MSREEAERLYKEYLAKLAQYHFEGNEIGVQSVLKEIEKVRKRLLNLDIANALEEYRNDYNSSLKSYERQG